MMDLELGEDQLELRQAAVGTLDRYAPLSLARSYLEGAGEAGELWKQIAELGWLGVGLDADDPFGVPGLCLLAEQVGRRAAPTMLVDTALVARVAVASNPEWAARIISGEPPLALAMLEPSAGWTAASFATMASRVGQQVVLSGSKTAVHHAARVGLLAVVVELEMMPAIALVEPTQGGVEITPLQGLDASCAACRVEFDGAPASIVLAGPAVESALPHALDVAAVAITAEGLGAASAALDLAIAYALDREQYGRKIGSFQALRHLLAEQHVLRETAWAAVLYAAAALEEQTDDARAAAAIAKAHGATASKAIVEGALQVFGGIGFTREHDLHILYRRALECADRFGGAEEHERRVAQTLPLPEHARAER
jgi:alkylation response protein AidB-like acyl-CoA dehydrogenase